MASLKTAGVKKNPPLSVQAGATAREENRSGRDDKTKLHEETPSVLSADAANGRYNVRNAVTF